MDVDFVAYGAEGGRTAAANMTKEERSERARTAALARGNVSKRVTELEERLARLEQLAGIAA